MLLFDTLITLMGIRPRPSSLLNDSLLNCQIPRVVVVLYQTVSLFVEIGEQSNLGGIFHLTFSLN